MGVLLRSSVLAVVVATGGAQTCADGSVDAADENGAGAAAAVPAAAAAAALPNAAQACAGLQCGPSPDGVLFCGTCPTDEECVSGRCTPRCSRGSCGMIGGRDCGGCGPQQACLENRCVDACHDPETGIARACGRSPLDPAVSCGGCDPDTSCAPDGRVCVPQGDTYCGEGWFCDRRRFCGQSGRFCVLAGGEDCGDGTYCDPPEGHCYADHESGDGRCCTVPAQHPLDERGNTVETARVCCEDPYLPNPVLFPDRSSGCCSWVTPYPCMSQGVPFCCTYPL